MTSDELLERWRHSINKTTLISWARNGKGPKCIRVGKCYLYDLKDIEEYENLNFKGK